MQWPAMGCEDSGLSTIEQAPRKGAEARSGSRIDSIAHLA